MRQAGITDGFAVVDLGCRFDAVGAIAEINFVDVELENLVLAQLTFNLQRQENFVDLAREAAFAAEKEILRDLHGDGAAAGLNMAALQ